MQTEGTGNLRLPCSPFVSVCSVVLLLAASGCIHAHAKAADALPPLDVPAPPPRVVETSDVEAPPPIGLIQEPGRNLPPGAARPSAPPPARAEAPKPPDEPPKPAPAATLQTTPAEQEGEVEARIRTVLTRATADLGRIDYTRLNANAKTQYDSAKRFVSLAEDALHGRNFVYAETLADKAAELATQLPGK